eukprot:m.335169 g.335169  ORF g.335169 m.335169 type:complete len:228 (+) comp17528_c0_seq1:127-810(+)
MPRWLPLESNPDVMNEFIHKAGVPESTSFYDIYGTDPELLGMVPQPCYAVLLLFPSSKQGEHKAAEAARIEKDGQVVDPSAFYLKQTIGNACGTIGILHAIGNNLDSIELNDGFLKSFMEDTKGMTPEERGAHLEKDEGITTAHGESAQQGQTSAPSENERVDLHFICFAEVNGSLYEFDGCKIAPINHGSTTKEDFLAKATGVCKQFMERDPTSMEFTMVALCKSA